MAFGDEEHDVTAEHLAGSGVGYDPEVSRAVKEAYEDLGVAGNAAWMMHVDGGSIDEAREYVMRWALTSEKRDRHVLRFIDDPMWRSYSTRTPRATGCARLRRRRSGALQAAAHGAAHARRSALAH